MLNKSGHFLEAMLMVRHVSQNSECTVVSHYGLEGDLALPDAVLRAALHWLESLNLSPDLLGTSGNGGKLRRFSRSLIDKVFDSPMSSFELVSLPPKAKTKDTGALCQINYRTERPIPCFIFMARSDCCPLGSQICDRIAYESADMLKPHYGIGYTRSRNLGPVLYAMCIEEGNVSEREGLRISRWSDALRYDLYKSGVIRDVYPVNYLNKRHLERKVEGAPLQDWIGASASHGSVSPFTSDLVMWQVKDSELRHVKRLLASSDIIYDYERHILAARRLLKPRFEDMESASRFFQAWAMIPPAEISRMEHSHTNLSVNAEEVVRRILQRVGLHQGTRVIKVDGPGQTHDLSPDEIVQLLGQPKKNKS